MWLYDLNNVITLVGTSSYLNQVWSELWDEEPSLSYWSHVYTVVQGDFRRQYIRCGVYKGTVACNLSWTNLCDKSYLWSVHDIFRTRSYQSYSFHACVRESWVTGKLRKTFHRILKGVQHGWETALKDWIYQEQEVNKLLTYIELPMCKLK